MKTTTDRPMDIDALVLERLAQKQPLATMAAQTAHYLLAREPLDSLFENEREFQYTRQLTFSTLVNLLSEVVLGSKESVRHAYRRRSNVGASLAATYEKLNGIEPHLCTSLVAWGATRAGEVMHHFKTPFPALLPGYRLRIVDGSHKPATQRKIRKLRGIAAGPLPCAALVVYDPQRDIPEAMLPMEDAYQQERALCAELVALAQKGDCWVADRNFCTTGNLCGWERREAAFVVREHANLSLVEKSDWQFQAQTEDATLEEQSVETVDDKGQCLPMRRIRITLAKPTRNGDQVVMLLTTLPRKISAETVAKIYRARWKIEKAFHRLERVLNTEIDTLGYPKAALFGMAVGLLAYTMVSVIQASINEAHGPETAGTLSWYEMTTDIEAGIQGVVSHAGEATVDTWSRLTAAALAVSLVGLAKVLPMHVYRKVVKKKPSAPPQPRTRYKNRRHVSTYRVLNGTQTDEPHRSTSP